MSKIPNTPLEFSSRYVIYPRKQEGILPLTYSEWRRLKKMAGKIKCPNKWYNTLGSICIGLFTSSLIALFTFNAATRNWCRITMICICVLSVISAIVFFILNHSQLSETTLLGQDIVDEMDIIENSFSTPLVNGREYPLV